MKQHSKSLVSLPLLTTRNSTSVRTSPRRASNDPTPIARLPTSRLRLNAVLDKCHTLRHDLTSTYHDLRAGPHLQTYTQFRQELDSPPRARWQSSPRYLEVKQRILEREQDARDFELGTQVTSLQAKDGMREVKLTLRKTRVEVGRKAREVEVPVHVDSKMLGAFLLAEKIAKNQRNFGEKVHCPLADEMDEFWKEEIEKYEKQRNDRILGPNPKPQQDSGLPLLRKDTKLEAFLSPLQQYVQSYNSKKLFGEALDNSRKRRLEEKMQSIQPSKEVAVLAQKYLPKKLRRVHRQVGSFGGTERELEYFVPAVQRKASMCVEEDFLRSEIQKELEDTRKLLSLETIMSSNTRAKRTKASF